MSTSAPTIVHAEPLPEVVEGVHAAGWWGMVWFIATEAMLFACFIASYLYLRGNYVAMWEEGGHNPSLKFPIIMTVLLLSSSVVMWWGERGIKQGDQMRLRIGMGVAWVLALLFLVLQGWEYASKDYSIKASAYDSIFVTTTSFHGAHVAAGLLMSLFVQSRAWLGHFTAKRHLAVQNVALYWHFVDTVWLAIFITMYLSPRLW
jgi:heme/copper-type cytochrome/quinol oxidase subunit 3